MKAIKNIIIPSDFSSNANRAVAYALKLYGNEDVNFILYHSYDPPLQNGILISVSDIIRNEAQRNLKRDFEKITRELNIFPKKVTFVVEGGLFHKVIKVIVGNHSIDLIVMGTKGITYAKEAVLGSNTSKIIKLALCPVLVVPDCVDNDVPTKILLAEDYKNPFNFEVLEPLKELALKFNASIDILYVKTNGSSIVQADARAKFDAFLGDIPHKFHFIERPDVANTIEEFMHEDQAKMVVTLPGKNNIFDDMLHKSVTNKIALHTEIPLLTLPHLPTK